MSFSRIIDHADTLTLLRHYSGQNKVPHAVLFHGTAGTGKALIALEFAKTINCTAGGDEACDKCANCVKADGGFHPDVFFVRPESLSREILIEQIRDMQNRLFLKPFEGRRKICIIEDAHAMNVNAANALLKTLEEPPETSHIFLISDKPHNLLPTILSRCHKIHCRPLSAPVIERFLREEMGLGGDEAESIAVFSDGSLGKAQAMARGDGVYGASDLIVSLLLELRFKSPLAALETVGELKNFLSELYKQIEAEVLESLKTDDMAGLSAREKKSALKAVEAQARIKASSMLVEEMNKLLHLCAFVMRDVYMAQNGRHQHIANKAFADRIDHAARSLSPRRISETIETIARMKREMVFNMSPQDAVELLFLKIACAPA